MKKAHKPARNSYYDKWFDKCKKYLGIRRKIKWGFYDLEQGYDGELEKDPEVIKVSRQLCDPESIERTLLYELLRVRMGSFNWWAFEKSDTLLESHLVEWENFCYSDIKKQKDT